MLIRDGDQGTGEAQTGASSAEFLLCTSSHLSPLAESQLDVELSIAVHEHLGRERPSNCHVAVLDWIAVDALGYPLGGEIPLDVEAVEARVIIPPAGKVSVDRHLERNLAKFLGDREPQLRGISGAGRRPRTASSQEDDAGNRGQTPE